PGAALQPAIAPARDSPHGVQLQRRGRARRRARAVDHRDCLCNDAHRPKIRPPAHRKSMNTGSRQEALGIRKTSAKCRAFFLYYCLLPVACCLASAVGAAEPSWEQTLAAAKKEGSVVVVGSPDPVMRSDIIPKFTARFGIPVE